MTKDELIARLKDYENCRLTSKGQRYLEESE